MTFTTVETTGGREEIFEGSGTALASAFGRPNRYAFGMVSGEKRERSSSAQAHCIERWRALDRLLVISFGLISPAYLFGVFPPAQ
jgi:hypothetical protein